MLNEPEPELVVWKEHLLRVKDKQGLGRGFILLLPQAACIFELDAGNKPASSFVTKTVRPQELLFYLNKMLCQLMNRTGKNSPNRLTEHTY